MKLPKNANRFCPYCRKHTQHRISLNKKKNPRSMTYGSLGLGEEDLQEDLVIGVDTASLRLRNSR